MKVSCTTSSASASDPLIRSAKRYTPPCRRRYSAVKASSSPASISRKSSASLCCWEPDILRSETLWVRPPADTVDSRGHGRKFQKKRKAPPCLDALLLVG